MELIKNQTVEVLRVDRERLVHNFVATVYVYGIPYQYTGHVSDIRAAKMDVDSFRILFTSALEYRFVKHWGVIISDIFNKFHVLRFPLFKKRPYGMPTSKVFERHSDAVLFASYEQDIEVDRIQVFGITIDEFRKIIREEMEAAKNNTQAPRD